MSVKSRSKMLLLVIIFVCFAYLIYFTNIYTKVKRLDSEIKAKQDQKNEFDTLKMDNSQAEIEIQKLEKELNHLEEKIPSYDYTSEVAIDIYNRASAGKLNVDKIKTEASVEKGAYNAVRMLVETNGTKEDIIDLLSYFKDNRRKILIKGFRLQSMPDNTYSGQIKVELYYVNP